MFISTRYQSIILIMLYNVKDKSTDIVYNVTYKHIMIVITISNGNDTSL